MRLPLIQEVGSLPHDVDCFAMKIRLAVNVAGVVDSPDKLPKKLLDSTPVKSAWFDVTRRLGLFRRLSCLIGFAVASSSLRSGQFWKHNHRCGRLERTVTKLARLQILR